jgi:hypothetical protein
MGWTTERLECGTGNFTGTNLASGAIVSLSVPCRMATGYVLAQNGLWRMTRVYGREQIIGGALRRASLNNPALI